MPEPARLFLRQHDHLDGFLREALFARASSSNASSSVSVRRVARRAAPWRRAIEPFYHHHTRPRVRRSHAPQTSPRRPIACRARGATLGSRARARAPRRSSRARRRASPRSRPRRARIARSRSAPRMRTSSRARGASTTTTTNARGR